MADKAKRKGLMSLLTEYQNENNKSGLTKYGDSKSDIAEARKRQAKVKASAAKKKETKKKTTPPKEKTTLREKTPPKEKTTLKEITSPKEKTPPISTTLYSGGNVGSGRDGRPGTGTQGRLMPSNPRGMRQTRAGDKPKRKPGTGRTGYAAQRRAMRPKKEEKKMTATERRQMRLRARRGKRD